jgi:hypothetical protein
MYKVLVILSNGYDQKWLSKYGDKFLWEHYIEHSGADTVAVLANRTNFGFWEKYIAEKKPEKAFSVFVEPHEREEDFVNLGIFNRINYVLQTFSYRSPMYVVTPIMWFEKPDFLKEMWEIPSLAIKRMFCDNDFSVELSLSNKIKRFVISSGFSWKIVGVFSAPQNILNYLGEIKFKTVEEAIVFLANRKNVVFHPVKVRGKISYTVPEEKGNPIISFFKEYARFKKFE